VVGRTELSSSQLDDIYTTMELMEFPEAEAGLDRKMIFRKERLNDVNIA